MSVITALWWHWLIRYRKLGRKEVGGGPAEGVEITDPTIEVGRPVDSLAARLWVGVETGYPVMMKMEIVTNGGASTSNKISDEFRWNVSLDESLFEPNIPDDYTAVE